MFLFDRLVSQAKPLVHGRITILTIQLNVHYRMHEYISNVANSLSRRFVETPLTDQRTWFHNTLESNSHHIYQGHLHDYGIDMLTQPVV